MPTKLTTIAFDADDTLWHNERFFRVTQDRFAELLSEFTEKSTLEDRLLAAEIRNHGHYGFGVKGFVLSMIETAIEVTDEAVPASLIAELIAAGREMLEHPIDLLPHAAEAVAHCAQDHRVMLITKGDLLDQERKVAQSGLGDMFDHVEVVSDKTRPVYEALFARHADGIERAMMIGNSMKSDVVPVVEGGGWGVYVPHGESWALEHALPPKNAPRYHSIDSLGELPLILERVRD